MKFDMHCHTKEGSLDSKVPVSEYVNKFRMLGFDGFMIADHNSYKGCRAWDKMKDDPRYANFTVIRGIEYDTKDAGHVLIIMPDNLYLPVLTIRGMRLRKLKRLVHTFGGVIGLAHPFGAKGSSAMGFKNMDMKALNKLDFIETFNTCELPLSNTLAQELAEKYGLLPFAGSDSHVTDYIGMACTEIDADITCNNDLIRAVQSGVAITAGGQEREATAKGAAKEHWIGVMGYKIYNRGLAKLRFVQRKRQHRKILDLHNLPHHKGFILHPKKAPTAKIHDDNPVQETTDDNN